MAKKSSARPRRSAEFKRIKDFLLGITVSSGRKVKRKKHKPASKDNLLLKGKQDDIRINIKQYWEREYWSKRLGVTEEELTAAVKKVGCLVKDVANEFKKD